jgi:5-bromo-4-chloroindolyl phosphate hydrolysis protein
MEQENKNQIAQSLSLVKEQIKRWEKVYNIAQDIIAYAQQDARRFRLEVGNAVYTRIIYGYVSGTERYITYESDLNELSLSQVLEKFFSDDRALVNMVRRLAEAVAEIAEEKVEELKEQLEE